MSLNIFSLKQFQIKKLISLINKSISILILFKINIEFYKNNFEKINQYDKSDDSILEITKDILNTKNIIDLYRKSSSDYNIVSLNILENFHKWVNKSKHLSNKEKLKIIDYIYYNACIGDYLSMFIHLKNDWDLSDNITTYSIYIPTILLNINNIPIDSIKYNGYISKSIINTHSSKLFTINNINVTIINLFYHYFYLSFNYNDRNYSNILKNIVKKFNLNIKVIERYYKLFSKYYILENKSKLKLFF